MRKARTISLTPRLSAYIDQRVKEKGYASPSEYIRDLLRKEMDYETFQDIQEAEADIKAGRVYRAKSMRDLLK